MTDGVAMLTKAKENLMFTMAALSEAQRWLRKHFIQSAIENTDQNYYNGLETIYFCIVKFHCRVALSQGQQEFIEMCSFNGKECDIKKSFFHRLKINCAYSRDFKLHVDPEFGNCYTFNYDVTNNYTSSRAGPMYGGYSELDSGEPLINGRAVQAGGYSIFQNVYMAKNGVATSPGQVRL